MAGTGLALLGAGLVQFSPVPLCLLPILSYLLQMVVLVRVEKFLENYESFESASDVFLLVFHGLNQ